MYKIMAILGMTSVLVGWASAGFAQSPMANSAAVLEGLQERSIPLQPTRTATALTNVPKPSSLPLANNDPTNPQIILSQPSDRTQVILSPVTATGPMELGTNSGYGAGLTGNNKVQLLYELDQ